MFSRVSFEKKKKTGYSGHRLTEIGPLMIGKRPGNVFPEVQLAIGEPLPTIACATAFGKYVVYFSHHGCTE